MSVNEDSSGSLHDVPRSAPWSTELSYAQIAAVMLSEGELGLVDFFSGVFIVAFERIGRYWEDRARLEDLIRSRGGLDKPRWAYWLDLKDAARAGELGGLRPVSRLLHGVIE